MKISPLLAFAEDHKRIPLYAFLEKYPWPFLLYPGEREKKAPTIAYPKVIHTSPPKRQKKHTILRTPSFDDTLPPAMRQVIPELALVIPLPFEGRGGIHSVRIGRSEEMDLYIEDKEISQFHATIFSEKEHFFIQDEHSTNETYVNGIALPPLEKHPLHDQDAIEFGLGKLFFFLFPQTVLRIVKNIQK